MSAHPRVVRTCHCPCEHPLVSLLTVVLLVGAASPWPRGAGPARTFWRPSQRAARGDRYPARPWTARPARGHLSGAHTFGRSRIRAARANGYYLGQGSQAQRPPFGHSRIRLPARTVTTSAKDRQAQPAPFGRPRTGRPRGGRCAGGRGRGRTSTPLTRHRLLRPARLPFRHSPSAKSSGRPRRATPPGTAAGRRRWGRPDRRTFGASRISDRRRPRPSRPRAGRRSALDWRSVRSRILASRALNPWSSVRNSRPSAASVPADRSGRATSARAASAPGTDPLACLE